MYKIKQLISRKEAHAKGLVHYYTGKDCKHGHDALRYVCTGACLDCVLWARRPISAPNILDVKFIFEPGRLTSDDKEQIKQILLSWAPAALAQVQKKNAERARRVLETEIQICERSLSWPVGDEDYCTEPYRSKTEARLAKARADLKAMPC